tara:strand:+ start:470 stop:1504 length:1035 start_codon:yes stop_codon:yes gene_type:complete
MKKKIALITGISGQDGAYLAQFLLNKKYTVIGTDRRSARGDLWRLRRLKIENKVILEEMELSELYEIDTLFKKYKNIDEVYNLASQSFVGTSFKSPINTSNITGQGVLRILECIRNNSPKTKLYQASSSEMYGDNINKFQNEKTVFNPQSPYACAKVFGHYLVQNYRTAYNMYCVSGILFNHESPLRGEEFVTRKVVIGFSKLHLGGNQTIQLGNIYPKRDWGYAKEYVAAMWKMMQKKKPEDFVISTGNAYSVKDFINEIIKQLNIKAKWTGKGLGEKLINQKNNKVLVKINKKYFRPAEVNFLKGDSSKARKKLNWKPKFKLSDLVKIMLEEEIKNQKKIKD